MSTHHQGPPHERRALDPYIKLARAPATAEATINRHLTDAGLTTSQFGVLEALWHLGPLSLGQLADKILKSNGNLTFVVDNLAKRGLVTRARSERDRRVVTAALTAEGERLIAGLFPRHVERVVATFVELSAAEQETLARLCRKLGLAQRAVSA
jgi:MarR family 2-MHQ and catechol resistance regulon transcriptional repressor